MEYQCIEWSQLLEKKIKEKCLDALYPPRCPACGGILEDKQRRKSL